jgi:hypothetical protein
MSIVEFVYNGEVNVAQDDLTSFLAVAEDLKIKGLTQELGGSGSGIAQQQPQPPQATASTIEKLAKPKVTRVTCLGEFSPIGSLFTLGSFMKITEIAQLFWLLFLSVKITYYLQQTIGWATLWAIFTRSGTDVMIFKNFSPKNLQKYWRF